MGIYRFLMHRWERKLTLRDRNRRVFPYNWGLEWIGLPMDTGSDPVLAIKDYAEKAVLSSRRYFEPPPIQGVQYEGDRLIFDTPSPGPHEENLRVRVSLFPAAASRKAVIVVPQWNADSESHVGLCRILQRMGYTAARLTLPYHEGRKPRGMIRADLAVGPNIGRTLHANRQAVLEVRQLVRWLKNQGFEKIGIVGTSLGSCISYLCMTHDSDIDVGVFNHVSAFFADVVWTGLSTRYIRWTMENKIRLEDLRACWAPLSPWYYVDKFREDPRSHLLITAKYDLTFLPELSEKIFDRYRELDLEFHHTVLPCGHYTTAHFPHNYLDAWHVCRFLKKEL